jgi:hypothetical protein
MKFVCPMHGSSLHYHVCRHVNEACDSGGPLPDIDLPALDLICRGCLTAEVRELQRLLDMSNIDTRSEESIEEGAQRFFDAHETLRQTIGYWPLCTDCLYEKTGLDLRRRPLSTHA